MRTIWSMVCVVCVLYAIGFTYKNCSNIKEYEDKNKVTVPQLIKEKGKSVEEQFIEFYNYIRDRNEKKY